MKFFHLSDLHIGLKLINRDLQEDQEYILNQIVEMAKRERPDAVIVAGDIYDKAVPSAEAVEMLDHFITALTAALPEAAVMLISGNHDSAPRVNCFRGILARQNVYMVGLPPQTEQDSIERVTLRDEYGEVRFYLLPFVRPSMVKLVVGTDENGNLFSYDETVHRLIERETVDENVRNVLVSHQFYLPAGKAPEEVERMDSEIRTVGNIDEVSADILERLITRRWDTSISRCRRAAKPGGTAGRLWPVLSVRQGSRRALWWWNWERKKEKAGHRFRFACFRWFRCARCAC